MKKITVLCLLLLCALPVAAQEKFLVGASVGISFTVAPDFSRWSETVRGVRSPDARSALEATVSGSVKVSERWHVGATVIYTYYEDVIDAYNNVQQARLSAGSYTPAATLAFEVSQRGSFGRLTVGLGPMFGTLTRQLAVTDVFQTVGVGMFVEGLGALGLTQNLYTTLSAAVRGGLTGAVSNSDLGDLTYRDSDLNNSTKPTTLSFVALSLRLGLAYRF
ncbi:MAG: hypothetical protein IAF08_15990 [Rhizobacter sp.]|nr:hypothetical protein [Chlorobiales bacterium]